MSDRVLIHDFALANPLYAGATVSFYTVSGGAKTTTLATLYAGLTGSTTVSNPQILDSEGKFAQPVYTGEAVIASVSGAVVGDHDTGIIEVPLADADFVQSMAMKAMRLAQYIFGNFLKLTGGVMRGNIDLNDHNLTNGNINLGGGTFVDAVAAGITETVETPALSGGNVTIDAANYNNHHHVITGNATLVMSGLPSSGELASGVVFLEQTTGNSFVITPPAAAVDNTGAAAGTITVTAEKMNVYTYLTLDGGTTLLWIEDATGLTPP